jgi:hypothetical protein
MVSFHNFSSFIAVVEKCVSQFFHNPRLVHHPCLVMFGTVVQGLTSNLEMSPLVSFEGNGHENMGVPLGRKFFM